MAYSDQESLLRQYLTSVDVYPDDDDMQTIVINSFYAECEQDNDDEWEDKIAHAVLNLDLFKYYVLKEWIEEEDEQP